MVLLSHRRLVLVNEFKVFKWDEILQGGFWDYQKIKRAGFEGTAITIGGFDGVHLGHKTLLKDVLLKENLLHGVITFSIPPRAIFSFKNFDGSVTTLSQRLNLFMEMGFDFVVVIDFSAEFGRMKGEHFLSVLNDKLFVSYVAEGQDFRCGHKGLTDMVGLRDFFSAFNVKVKIVPPVFFNGQRISSTAVRNSITSGDFATAKMLLGRPYALDCTVREWVKKGDEYISCSPSLVENQVLPPSGKYDVFLRFFIGQRTELFPSVVEICGKEIKVKLPDKDFVHSGILQAVEFTA